MRVCLKGMGKKQKQELRISNFIIFTDKYGPFGEKQTG